MKNSKVSIIVPVYKVENYLNKCIQSITDQTYKNLEIILVDDGSPDNCPQLCDNWAKQDSRIKVIHINNSGVAAARNAGLKVATGEYIGFVDSDDWIDKDMYEFLLNYMCDGIDIVRCSYRKIEQDIPEEFCNDGKKETLNSDEFLVKLFTNNILNSNCWCKLYRRSIIGDIKFPENIKIGEDHYFNYLIAKNADKIFTVNESKYNYLIRSSSVTNKTDINNWLQNVKLHKLIFESEKNNNETKVYAAECFANWVLDLIALCIKSNKIETKEYAVIRNILNTSFKDLNHLPLNKKLKVKLILAKYTPVIYNIILKIHFKRS